MRYFLGLLAAVALVAAGTKLGYDRFEEQIETGVGPRTTTTVPGTTLPSVLPSDNQVVVVGVVSSAHFESALIDPLPVPLTINTPERGLTSSGLLTGIEVDGADSSIHWDAGTPLVLNPADAAAPGSIALSAVTFDADASNMVVTFPDSTPQGISPGGYVIDSSVALSTGNGGLATPRDKVAFTAAGSATATFTGSASTTFPTKALHVKGPGKVVLTGSLTVVKPDKSQSKVSSVTLPSGPFTVTFTPDVNGLQIQATLQGAVTTS